MLWWRKKEPKDETLVEAHKLGRRTMLDPSRIYFWSLSHNVDLKAERKRLKQPGVLAYCIFTDSRIDQGEAFMSLPQY